VKILHRTEVERGIIEALMCWLSKEQKMRELLATELGLGLVGSQKTELRGLYRTETVMC
jgi:hypothetical protein